MMTTADDLPVGLPVGLPAASVKTSRRLNPEQELATKAPPRGVSLVIAGAGTGKTSGVILPRTEYLYAVDPGPIVILAFNNTIKDELQNKVENQLETGAASRTKVMTNHGLAYRLVMKYLDELQLPNGTEVIAKDWVVQKWYKERLSSEAGTNTSERSPHFETEFLQFTEPQLRAFMKVEEKALQKGCKPSQLKGEFAVLSQERDEIVDGFTRWCRTQRVVFGKLMFRDLIPLACLLPQYCFDNLHFKHILVDEAQDLSVDQHEIVYRLSRACVSLTFVGDMAQCFVPGTPVQTPLGEIPIELVRKGDLVTAASGCGKLGQFEVENVHVNQVSQEMLRVKTALGREFTCTGDHTLFARLAPAQDEHYVYLMYHADLGYRVGTTQGMRARDGSRSGLDVRCRQENADAGWVLKTCASKADALVWEQIYSVRYGVPELVFKPVDLALLTDDHVKFVFDCLDTKTGAAAIAKDLGIDLTTPHWQASWGDQAVTLTYLSYDRYQNTKCSHVLQWETQNDDLASAVRSANLPVRPAKSTKHGKSRWKVGTVRNDYASIRQLGHAVAKAAGVPVIERFNLSKGTAWDMMPAKQVFAGMQVPAVVGGEIVADTIVGIERTHYEGPVYDLDVVDVHNYIAAGTIVHNCIYKWNGARPDLFMGITDRYRDMGCRRYYLQTNYRCKQPILDVANKLLSDQIGAPIKLVPPQDAPGDPVVRLNDSGALVPWLEGQIESGVRHKDIAVLVRANAHALKVETALALAGIPYQCRSGSVFESTAVRDMISYIRFLSPSTVMRDNEDWEVIVNHTKYLGRQTAETSWDESKGNPMALQGYPSGCRTGGMRNQWDNTLKTLRSLVAMIARPGITAEQVLRKILELRVEPAWEDRWADDPEHLDEARMMRDHLLEWAHHFDSADAFLNAIGDLSSQDPRGVIISTVHKAKGLEWDVVALYNLGIGTFPLNHPRVDWEEEMCILYVAVTRARDTLALVRADDKEDSMLHKISEDQSEQLLDLRRMIDSF